MFGVINMTNLENIRQLKPKKLAELLIRVVEEPEDDDWDDDEFHWWNTRTWYVTPNDVYCYDMEEAIEVTVRWLSMTYKDDVHGGGKGKRIQ